VDGGIGGGGGHVSFGVRGWGGGWPCWFSVPTVAAMLFLGPRSDVGYTLRCLRAFIDFDSWAVKGVLAAAAAGVG
jgi:hypothetical protein